MYRVISRIQKAPEIYRLSNNLAIKCLGDNWKDDKDRLYTPVRYKGSIVGFTRRNTLSEQDIQLYSLSSVGKAFIAYNKLVGGSVIGLEVPVGYPESVDELGGVGAVYEKCIRLGITWEELLGVYYEYEPHLVDGGWKPLETAYRLLKSP